MTGKRLDSWKEIASYLGRQVRTVQGWEKQEGLPVHRARHNKLGSVFAYSDELDVWLAGREADSPPQDSPRRTGWPRGLAYAAVTAIALAAGLLAWSRWRAPQPSPAPLPLPLTERYFAEATRAGGSMRWLPEMHGVSLLALTPDGRTLVAGNPAGPVSMLDTRTDTVRRRWNLPAPVSALALSPDGLHLYALAGNGLLIETDLNNGRQRQLQLEAATAGFALAPGGGFAYIALPYAGLDRVNTSTLAREHWTLAACPQTLAASPDGSRLYVGFQCGGPGGSSGHDAIAAVDITTGAIRSRIAGPPRIGSPLAISPDGNEVWSNSDAACSAPQFDHRGCPFVPSELLQVFSGEDLRLLRTIAIPAASSGPQFGPLVFLPGGERVLDGDFLLSSSRYSALEVLPPALASVSAAAVARDGSRLYLSFQRPGATDVAAFSPTPAACSPPTEELADWWPGDGSADDAWGMVNARPSPAAAFAPGQVGQAFDLTRAGAYLTLGPDPSLDLSLRDLTLTAWVKFSTSGAVPILDKAGSWYLGRDAGGHLQFCPAGSGRPGCLTGASRLHSGTWYHIAVVAADGGGGLSLFVNAQRDALAAAAPPSPPVHAPLVVGADAERHSFLQGELDEFMLYHRALAPPDLQRLVREPACIAGQRR